MPEVRATRRRVDVVCKIKEDAVNAIIVCTEHRGVLFGRTSLSPEAILEAGSVKLEGAKMAIYWGTSRGVMELANTGPTNKSNISLPADIWINKVSAVFAVSDGAVKAWDHA